MTTLGTSIPCLKEFFWQVFEIILNCKKGKKKSNLEYDFVSTAMHVLFRNYSYCLIAPSHPKALRFVSDY